MPIANEENNIKRLIDKIFSLKILYLNIILIIDKFSKDNTKNIIEDLQKINNNIILLDYEKSTGVVSCYLHGFKYAIANNADYIIEMDAGESHDPEEIPNFLKWLNQGYDCVFGSRFAAGGKILNMPIYRKFISKFGTLTANMVLHTKFKDLTSGFEAFNVSVLKKLNFDTFLSLQTTHFMQTEIRYYCHNYKYIEIPIIYKGSKSSLNIRSVFKSFKILFELRKIKAC